LLCHSGITFVSVRGILCADPGNALATRGGIRFWL
jgi:hypothetical protein